MRLRRWSKWLVYDAAVILGALLLSAVSVPQISNVPPNVASIRGASCSIKSSYADVYDVKEKRAYETITVDAVGTGSYADAKEKPFQVLVSTRRAEITGENVAEETLAQGSRDCVRWVTMINRLVAESRKEARKKQ